MTTTSTLRTVLTPAAVLRLALGWGTFCLTLVAAQPLSDELPSPVLWAILVALIGVIVICAFGVVIEAEHLARRLGDPYGTLVLTLSIVMIEVILISAVMLGPGEHETIARDSVMAVSMIILNLAVGAALLVGGMRHSNLRPNSTGVSSYLSVLIVLLTIAFALPGLIGDAGAYTAGQEVPIIVLTIVAYAFFLFRQMGAQRADFQEIAAPRATGTPSTAEREEHHSGVLRRHRREVIARTLLLIVTVVPIVLLSHDMAALLDDGLARLGAPVALSGVLIAMIVFLPETITTIRAAHLGEIQRVSNLCHGALVSTVGLTIPAVLLIGLLTDQTVLLAETPTNLALLGATLLLTLSSFGGRRVTAIHGSAHLLIFVIYGITVFQ